MPKERNTPQPDEQLDWEELIPEAEWRLYNSVLTAADEQGIAYALGGGLAFSAYAGQMRNTKDLDLFIVPENRQALVDLLHETGFADYYEQMAYDRNWIYRAYQGDVIVDVIWQMANYRAPVDKHWLVRGREIDIRGRRLRLLPVEELIWSKLYVLQRERTDWPDLFAILQRQTAAIDWNHLLDRTGEDAPLIAGVMAVFGWLCPQQARQAPTWLWQQLGLAEPEAGPNCDQDRRRADLLDSRDWLRVTTERVDDTSND
jgi:predicted nucleotidyltransferase